jgi:DNA-binding NtrC family response regulator
VVEVHVPPLRERMEDMPLLAAHLLREIAQRASAPPKRLSPGALARLSRHVWPGNVRELGNVLSRAFVLGSDPIEVSDIALPPAKRSAPKTRRERDSSEKEALRRALEEHGWRVVDVARSLEIPRSTLYRKLKRHGLRRG